MASITLQGGAKVDLLTGDDLQRELDPIKRMLERPHFIPKTLVAAVNLSGAPAVPQLLDFGGCPDGSIWDLRLISVFGNDPWTAQANVTAALFVGQPPGNQAASVAPDVVMTGLALPSSTLMGGLRVLVRNRNHLYLLVNGSGLGTLTGTLHATANVVIVPDTSEALAWL